MCQARIAFIDDPPVIDKGQVLTTKEEDRNACSTYRVCERDETNEYIFVAVNSLRGYILWSILSTSFI